MVFLVNTHVIFVVTCYDLAWLRPLILVVEYQKAYIKSQTTLRLVEIEVTLAMTDIRKIHLDLDKFGTHKKIKTINAPIADV